jgi:hypothetical protein
LDFYSITEDHRLCGAWARRECFYRNLTTAVSHIEEMRREGKYFGEIVRG